MENFFFPLCCFFARAHCAECIKRKNVLGTHTSVGGEIEPKDDCDDVDVEWERYDVGSSKKRGIIKDRKCSRKKPENFFFLSASHPQLDCGRFHCYDDPEGMQR